MPSGLLESGFSPHTSSRGLSGAELTKLPLNALTSNRKGNCNARLRSNAPQSALAPERGVDGALGVVLDLPQMAFAAETLRIDLVDVLGA